MAGDSWKIFRECASTGRLPMLRNAASGEHQLQKGTEDAKKNLIAVPVTGTSSIPHAVRGVHDAGTVLLKPASEGTGVIAGGGVRAVLECAGISNVLSKSQGSSNPHNQVSATMNALKMLQDPAEVAARRGITIKQVFEG